MRTRFLPALFSLAVSGCATRPATPPEPRRPPSPRVEPEFDHLSTAHGLYQGLLQKGVTAAAMDKGCRFIDRTQKNPKILVKFAGDHRLQSCEVKEYVLEHWAEFPGLAESLIEGPIPWRFQDPATRSKVAKALRVLERDLAVLPAESEERLKKLIFGLFLFTLFPDRIPDGEDFRQKAERMTQALIEVGLQGLRDHLFREGGLGVVLIEKDAPSEATADEALRLKQGWCSEKSKILYAVFLEAGLRPDFFYVRMQDLLEGIEPVLQQRQATPFLPPEMRDMGHVYIGVRVQGKTAFADPTAQTIFLEYPHSIRLGLTHYLAIDLSNRAMGLQEERREREGVSTLLAAKTLDPQSGPILNNLALLMREGLKKNGPQARFLPSEPARILQEAVRVDPYEVMPWSQLGLTLTDFEEARGVLDEGLRFHPGNPRLLVNRAIRHYKQGADYDDIESLRKAEADFKEALARDPSNEWLQGLIGEVRDRISRLQEQNHKPLQ